MLKFQDGGDEKTVSSQNYTTTAASLLPHHHSNKVYLFTLLCNLLWSCWVLNVFDFIPRNQWRAFASIFLQRQVHKNYDKWPVALETQQYKDQVRRIDAVSQTTSHCVAAAAAAEDDENDGVVAQHTTASSLLVAAAGVTWPPRNHGNRLGWPAVPLSFGCFVGQNGWGREK